MWDKIGRATASLLSVIGIVTLFGVLDAIIGRAATDALCRFLVGATICAVIFWAIWE